MELHLFVTLSTTLSNQAGRRGGGTSVTVQERSFVLNSAAWLCFLSFRLQRPNQPSLCPGQVQRHAPSFPPAFIQLVEARNGTETANFSTFIFATQTRGIQSALLVRSQFVDRFTKYCTRDELKKKMSGGDVHILLKTGPCCNRKEK
jgi:hypothetical protein